MSELRFHVEWESPEGARGPELRATWARLRIEVDGEFLTQVEDRQTASVRDGVYGPMYPLAEWVAINWWSLLYEVASPARVANSYARRHTLSSASEGFALPWLEFRPEGRAIELVWRPRDLPKARVRFLAAGRRRLDHAQVEQALRSLVGSVVTRLDDQECSGTFLAEEWKAVEASDVQEQSFCRVAGSLGHDPCSLTKQKAGSIIRAADQLPPSIQDEFFASADPVRLRSQADAVGDFISEAEESDLQLEPLQRLRALAQSTSSQAPPWEQGYRFARWLRRRISLKDRPVQDEAELGEAFKLKAEDWRQARAPVRDKLGFLDALVAITRGGAPRLAVQHRSSQSRMFTLCRALFEYFVSGTATAAIVAPTQSDRQKRNRAFAAEFLVPSARLRGRIRGTAIVTEEHIHDLAQEFGASDLVIRHQIRNHHLADLAEWTF